MPQDEWPTLRVEGKDDKHVIKNLLSRHGVNHTAIAIKNSDHGEQDSGGKDSLLNGMRLAVTMSTGRSVGFVLDADDVPTDRWQAVRARLANLDLALPEEIPEGGFVGDALAVQARVGVWLMPDNRRSGALEEFLEDLVNNEDALLQHAEVSTTGATRLGAVFSSATRRKAVLHAWLAWQRRPGVPYGLAITAHYFRHDSPAALAFVNWFRRVFEAHARCQRTAFDTHAAMNTRTTCGVDERSRRGRDRCCPRCCGPITAANWLPVPLAPWPVRR